jgi:epoxyqueuosine reductase QueG
MRTFDQQSMQEMKEKLGVDLMGVVSVEKSTSRELRERSVSLLPGAASVLVLGKEIYKEVVSLLRPSKEVGEADPGELFGAHTDYLNGRLNRAVHELAGFFKQEGFRSLPLTTVSPVDGRFLTSLFSFKHAAELAGLGTMGRHSLLITPAYGPRVRLACVLTEAHLEPSERTNKESCANCNACIRKCPARAIQPPKDGEVYSINRFACRAYRQAGLICGVCIKACDEAMG